MADLDFVRAQSLAGSLTTLGHPYSQAAIDATAWDLVAWCKGVVIDGRVITPEQQAQALVTEARHYWDEWPEQGGTKQLLALFRRMFGPQPVPFGDQRRQWERDYGPPDRSWSEKFMSKAAAAGNKKADFARQKRELLLEGIRSAIYYTEGRGAGELQGPGKEKQVNRDFWFGAMKHYEEKHADTLAEVRQQMNSPEAA